MCKVLFKSSHCLWNKQKKKMNANNARTPAIAGRPATVRTSGTKWTPALAAMQGLSDELQWWDPSINSSPRVRAHKTILCQKTIKQRCQIWRTYPAWGECCSNRTGSRRDGRTSPQLTSSPPRTPAFIVWVRIKSMRFENHEVLTINVPLFKKLRDIIFFGGENHFMSHFEGHFEGAKTFLTP